MAKGDAAAAVPLIESGNKGITMAPFPEFNNAYLFTENFLSLNEYSSRHLTHIPLQDAGWRAMAARVRGAPH
ncbi:hypothetical protein [Aeromonas hydrophila]|jgi:hypothetical protein|uniref:hypothetical protein n=1 Tax=Aeromonas hydrophila TaxID=644 RepID=UPI0013C2AA86|nr:hypothetical protein [Aeromonas hydrophila]EHA1065066.1 hypothetical protein [Aeromonas hydrophila]MBM0436345.1 hypothetical protein [Aeromonas hydrophila subsp. ranae]MBW3826475.1 hypothetical protein [Aeromonas hydrophila]MCX4115773.1 hypothetical protein [Aeromonas hydrophila]MDD9229584.1 hypothetical protein [Aeromonas hydrophila]